MVEEKTIFHILPTRKHIAQTNLESTGVQNGGTQPYLRNFLVLKQVLASCLLITLSSTP